MPKTNKKIQKRQNRTAKMLQRLRTKWKQGFTKNTKSAAIQTKSSVRAVRGGLPGNGK